MYVVCTYSITFLKVAQKISKIDFWLAFTCTSATGHGRRQPAHQDERGQKIEAQPPLHNDVKRKAKATP